MTAHHRGDLVAYYRVSTKKQGESGLGLEAQQKAVARFAETEGFTVVSEFTEVESGKGHDALVRVVLKQQERRRFYFGTP